jgi:hypothetical protein
MVGPPIRNLGSIIAKCLFINIQGQQRSLFLEEISVRSLIFDLPRLTALAEVNCP